MRQAATLIVLRDGPRGLETLLLRRADKPNDQNSGASVFPGGLLDAHDRGLHGCCAGIDDAAASALLKVEAGGLDYFAAAVRECFEEAGLLFAQDARGALVDLDALGDAELASMRAAAAAGTGALLDLCRAHDWQLAVDRLAYFAHWVTPPGMPRRFDTRFFIAAVPPRQQVEIDRVEIAEQGWLRPADAIDPARGLKLMNVTRRILQQLAQFGSVEECLAHARTLRDIPRTMPRLAAGRDGSTQPVNMDHPAYEEVSFVDPEGRGHARHTLEGGLVMPLSSHVWRVTAGAVDAPGAHSYFVGAASGWALIDPVLDDAAHLALLCAAAPGPVRWLLSTQPSLSPAWRESWPEAQMHSFEPGAELRLGDALVLRMIAPAGDASSRGFLLLPGGLLFAGARAWAASDLPSEADWLAPAEGFLRAARSR